MRESLSPGSGRSTVPIYSTSFRTLTLELRTQVHLVLFLHLLSPFLITLFLTLQDALAGPANLQPPAGRFWQLDLTTNPHGKSDLCPWKGFQTLHGIESLMEKQFSGGDSTLVHSPKTSRGLSFGFLWGHLISWKTGHIISWNILWEHPLSWNTEHSNRVP